MLRYAILLIVCLLLRISNLSAQYHDVHYIAPSPWVYWTGAYEVVLSTEYAGTVNVSITKGDGTPMINTTVAQGNPTAVRFTGNPAGVLNHPINTVLNDAGMIVTANQPVAVNVRNIASDQVGSGGCTDIKGNASLTSFGKEGVGINFRLGYYRTNFNGVGFCHAQPIVIGAMATQNNTQIFLNGTLLATLNSGQSYVFVTTVGTLLTADNPIVVTAGAYVDSPQGCGDGVVDQVAPVSVLDTAYFVVRGLGTAGTAPDLPELTTVVATKPATNVRVDNYTATGAFINSTNYVLTNAGNAVTFPHGDATTQYSSSHIVGSKDIAVFAGSAVSCEVDMSFVPPVGPCAGSFRVETTEFKSYLNNNLPYNGYVLVEDPTAIVYMNGVNLESITAPRFQIGTTGFYMIRFSDVQIGNPADIVINCSVRMNISIVQQGGGFSMSAFFSSFNQVLDPPILTPNGVCRTGLFTAEPGYAPYQWYLDEVLIPGASGQTYVATASGNYSVAGTRPCGLTKPSTPTYFNDSATTPDLSVLLPDTLKCNVTSVVLTASTTTPGATYNWGGGNTNPTYSVSAPGNYIVTVTEPINNCDSTATIVVAQNITPPQVSIAPPPDLDCNNASINLVASSTTAGTTFNWGGSNTTDTRTVSTAGTYTVTATDPGNGCTATANATVTAIPPLALSETHVNVACFGGNNGSINLTVSGGETPYNFLWSTGATTEDIGTLIVGSYTVTVTDNQACTQTLTVAITEPAAALTLDTNLTHVLCFGGATGSIDLIPAGGTTPYVYAWNDAVTTQDRNNIVAGNYGVTVTDANGCTATLSATVAQPANALSATSIITDATCYNGTDGGIDLSPAGAVAPYTFRWSNAATTEDLSNLAAGSYTVTITDANGCTAIHTATINQPSQLTVTLDVTGVACNGDTDADVNSTVAGGTPGYAYLWGDASTGTGLTGVGEGNYSLTVTDQNQCTATATANVVFPPAITFSYAVADVSCFGNNDGQLQLNASGGTGAITASWAGGEYPDNSFTGIGPGNYTMILTDANGCDTSFAFTVTEPGPVSIDILPIDTLRLGFADTLETVSVTNPGSVSYLWEPSDGLSCDNCPAPEVEVYWDTPFTVTLDNNGCTATDTVWVYVNTDHTLFIPNAFSPNGDGRNDVFYVYAQGVKKVVWSIYDRWGEIVFTSADIDTGWDGTMKGKKMPPGVFIVDVYIEFLDLKAERHTQSVVLLR